MIFNWHYREQRCHIRGIEILERKESQSTEAYSVERKVVTQFLSRIVKYFVDYLKMQCCKKSHMKHFSSIRNEIALSLFL